MSRLGGALPCPHCNSSDIGLVITYDKYNTVLYTANCEVCRMKGPVGYNKKAALSAWNRLCYKARKGTDKKGWFARWLEKIKTNSN